MSHSIHPTVVYGNPNRREGGFPLPPDCPKEEEKREEGERKTGEETKIEERRDLGETRRHEKVRCCRYLEKEGGEKKRFQRSEMGEGGCQWESWRGKQRRRWLLPDVTREKREKRK